MRLRIMRFHAYMRLCGCGFLHICAWSAYWYMRKCALCACLFRTAYVSAYTNKLWGIRSSLNMNEHSQFVQWMFSKSLIDRVAHLSWLFIWAYAVFPRICSFSAYIRFFCICGYKHTLCRFFYAVSCGYAHIKQLHGHLYSLPLFAIHILTWGFTRDHPIYAMPIKNWVNRDQVTIFGHFWALALRLHSEVSNFQIVP